MMGGLQSYLTDPRRRDFFQGLGQSLMQNAGTQGLGGLNDAFAGGLDYQRAAAEKREKEERERIERERQDTQWQHYMEKYNAAKTEAERKRIAEEAERKAEAERRRQAIEVLPEGQRQRFGLLPREKFWSEWTEATGAEEPRSPTLRNFPDGSLREWKPSDPEADENGWVLLQHKPRGTGAEAPIIRALGHGRQGRYNPETGGFEVIYEPPDEGPGSLTANQLVMNARIEAGRIYDDSVDRATRIAEALYSQSIDPTQAARVIQRTVPGVDPSALQRLFSRPDIELKPPTADEIIAILPSYDDIRKGIMDRLVAGGSYGQPADQSAEQQVRSVASNNPQQQQVIERLRAEGKSWEEILRLMQESRR